MKFEEFKDSIQKLSPPAILPASLQALWYDGKGDWHRAHNVAQDLHSTEGSWIHAYLHRKEGDEGNAGYWYQRANKPFCTLSLDEEWESIVKALLN